MCWKQDDVRPRQHHVSVIRDIATQMNQFRKDGPYPWPVETCLKSLDAYQTMFMSPTPFTLYN
jgi:hypothetical protein